MTVTGAGAGAVPQPAQISLRPRSRMMSVFGADSGITARATRPTNHPFLNRIGRFGRSRLLFCCRSSQRRDTSPATGMHACVACADSILCSPHAIHIGFQLNKFLPFKFKKKAYRRSAFSSHSVYRFSSGRSATASRGFCVYKEQMKTEGREGEDEVK